MRYKNKRIFLSFCVFTTMNHVPTSICNLFYNLANVSTIQIFTCARGDVRYTTVSTIQIFTFARDAVRYATVSTIQILHYPLYFHLLTCEGKQLLFFKNIVVKLPKLKWVVHQYRILVPMKNNTTFLLLCYWYCLIPRSIWHKGREVMKRSDKYFSCAYFSLFGRYNVTCSPVECWKTTVLTDTRLKNWLRE